MNSTLNILDFEKVHLSTSDLRILNAASVGKVIDCHPIYAEYLLTLGFLTRYALSDTDSQFVITDMGLRYKEYLATEAANAVKRAKQEKFRYWFGVILSNAIAILALIVSIYAAWK